MQRPGGEVETAHEIEVKFNLQQFAKRENQFET